MLAGGPSSGILAPYLIFLLVLTLHIFQRIVDHLKKRDLKSKEQIQLRQEIKELSREANLLSTPSTFAQAAKLRRLAAAKEKELSKITERSSNDRDWFFVTLFAAKGFLFLCLTWWFWGAPIVQVPLELMKPFVRVLSWTSVDPSTGLVPVGIIPWLVLTSQVSSFICHKVTGLF